MKELRDLKVFAVHDMQPMRDRCWYRPGRQGFVKDCGVTMWVWFTRQEGFVRLVPSGFVSGRKPSRLGRYCSDIASVGMHTFLKETSFSSLFLSLPPSLSLYIYIFISLSRRFSTERSHSWTHIHHAANQIPNSPIQSGNSRLK